MKYVLPLLILINTHEIIGILEWTVTGKVTDYGQNVTLFCHVPNCCPKDAGWDRWTPVQQTLFIDVKTGRSNKKYDGKVMKDGYTLVIQNLTEQDLNVSYSCLYGVTLGEQKFLLEEDVFTRSPNSNSRFSVGEIAALIAGVVALVLVLIIIIEVWRRRKKRKPINSIKKQDSNTEMDKLIKFSRKIKNMTSSELNIYTEAMNSGKEVRRYVRIQVVGRDGVGKTSLVRRLLGERNIDDVESTNGIDVTVKKCQIRTKDGKWIVGKVEKDINKMVGRVQQAVELTTKGNQPPFDQSPSSKIEVNYQALTQADENVFQTVQNEGMPLLVDAQLEKDGRQNQSILRTDGVGFKAGHKNNDEITSTKNISAASNVELEVENKADKNDLNKDKQSEQINVTTSEQTNVASKNNDEVIRTVIDNMNDILKAAKHSKNKMQSEGFVECGIWDFAGQKEYYAAHQTFCTPHAIYILVADINDDIKHDNNVQFDSIGEYIDFWLDSIHCFCYTNADSKMCPPVIVVLTGIDKVNDEKATKKKFEEHFKETFGNQKKVNHTRYIHFISNKFPKEADFQKLKNNISNVAKDMDYFAEELPTRWIQLEYALAVLKDMNEQNEKQEENCQKFETIAKLAEKISMDKNELSVFLNYQHKIGNIIFFKDIPDYIILQPEWLIKCLRCFVCDINHHLSFGDNLYGLGYGEKLSDDLITELLKQEPELKFEEHKKHILDVMEQFHIIVKPQCNDNSKAYFMPFMIKKTSTIGDIIENNFKNFKEHRTPWLVFEFEFLPIAYFNYVLFYFITAYKVCNVKSPQSGDTVPAIYHGKAVVFLDKAGSKLLFICFSKNAISLQICSNTKQNDNESNDWTHKDIISKLRDKIAEFATKSMHTSLAYEIKAKCSLGDYSISSGRINCEIITTNDGQYNCFEHDTSHYKDDIENTWLKHVAAIEREEKQQAEQKEKTGKEKEEILEKNIPIPKNRKVLTEAITQLSKGDKISYNQLMQSSKKEKRYFVRTMIVGKETVGKTCLMSRLLKEDISGVTSTDGVDIVVRRCKINIDDGTWTIGKEIADDRVDRIKRALIQNDEDRDTQNMQVDETRNMNILQGEEMSTYDKDTATDAKVSLDKKGDTNESSLLVMPEDFTTDAKVSLDKSGDTNESSLLVMPEDFTTDAKVSLDNFKETTSSSSLVMPEDLLSNMFSKSTDNNLSNRYTLCELWDFAGQKEFYATHQAFLTSSAVYLVVADMKDDISKQGLSQCFADFQNIEEYVDFWFDSIHCHRTSDTRRVSDGHFDPPIILVFTGKDKYNEADFKKREQELNYQIDRVFGLQSKYYHLHRIFYLSNTKDTDEEFEKLRYAIYETARTMDNWGKAFPLKWILLEHLIEINKMDGKTFISFTDMITLAKHHDINILKEHDLLLFLRFQHNVGNIIFFENIRDLIILSPQWLADAFRCLVSDRHYYRRLQHRKDWTLFKRQGKISESLITDLFELKKGSLFSGQKINLHKVMEKLDILVKIENSSYYIMPSMMPVSTFDDVCKIFGILDGKCKRTSWLCFKFQFLPPSFFNHLSAWFIRKYDPSKVDEGIALYRGICMFDIDRSGRTKILITMSTDTIALQVVSFSEQEISRSTCSDIYSEVAQLIEDIKNRYKVKLYFKLHFKCSDGYYFQDTFAYANLKSAMECYCLQHKRAHQSDLIYLPWMKNEVKRIPDKMKISIKQDDHNPKNIPNK